MLVQIKDNSTLAKLLATEDIHVTYKNARTASFDVKTRELVIPIMKEMSKDTQDLMTLHEVGHALFTSLDMLQESIKRKLDHSFVNVIEDVRIEKAIQNKYRGSKSAFKRGYQDLIGMNFFETDGRDINKYNLIDRINLFYKHHEDVQFSEDEKVWVKKVGDCVTEKDVLDVAEELHAYIKDNKESQGEDEDNSSKMLAPDMDSGEDTAEQEGKMIYSGMQFSDEENDTEESEEESTESSSSSEGDGEEETETTASSGGDEKTENGEVESSTDGIEGGQSDGDAKIKSVTDQASRNSLDDLVDENADEKKFVNIPKINLKETIFDYKKVGEMLDKTYTLDTIGDCKKFYDTTLDDITKYEKDAKKASEKLLSLGVQKVIITLGEKGLFYSDGTKDIFLEATKIKALDTTGAGDAFNGAFALAISKSKPINECLEFANKVAGLSTTKLGAGNSMPFIKDLK